ncbi:MAG: ATP-grasp domain-containing protein, partial [Gemmatimonadaceae bacterium]|nr:ATP-grasp domain-containing protein [Gemmatimonadaceae bacterium]
GYRVHVLDPAADCAAHPVVERVVVAALNDARAAARLARECDVVTMEIEQIGGEALQAAASHAPLRPAASVLHIVQDRGRQKEWLTRHGAPIGPYRLVESASDLADAERALGAPLIAKACEGGYDGRSQLHFVAGDDPAAAFASLGSRRAVAEQALSLELELSVLVARRPSGETTVYPPAVNHHERQVLAWSTLPGELPDGVATMAGALALDIAHAIGLEGILAVEMFLLTDGRLLVNELAPRPHNSYHGADIACATGQFEQLVRAVCDLPLGSIEPLRPSAIVNLFGDLWLHGRPPDFSAALAVPGTRLALYGKSGARAGRKMGHLAATGANTAEALARARAALARLSVSTSNEGS